jgi:hypothetical protein
MMTYVPKRGYDRFKEPMWPNVFPHWVRPLVMSRRVIGFVVMAFDRFL